MHTQTQIVSKCWFNINHRTELIREIKINHKRSENIITKGNTEEKKQRNPEDNTAGPF